MSRCVIILALLLALPASATAGARSPTAVPISLDMDGRIAITVRINGNGPFRFRLDTGASRTVVSATLAATLALPPAGQSRTITHTGQSVRGMVRADELVVGPTGDLSAQGLVVLVLPPEAIDRAGRVDGLLGQDVLSRWMFTIDYRQKHLFLPLESPARDKRAVRLPLVRSAGSLLAAVELGGAAGPLHLVPDSGADRLVLFGASSNALPSLTLLETVRVRSISGEASARLVQLGHLELGGIAVGDLEALVLEEGPSGGVMGDGLLPLHLFGRVTFDLPGASLWLEPRR